jgi:hypothetical protein
MTLDEDERRALVLSTFVASCLCFAPGQVVSGAFLLIVSGLLWRWDARKRAAQSHGSATER